MAFAEHVLMIPVPTLFVPGDAEAVVDGLAPALHRLATARCGSQRHCALPMPLPVRGAMRAGCAPGVVLEATSEKALDVIPFELLQQHTA